MSFVPYCDLAPDTKNVAELRAEYYRVRELYGRGSFAKEAYDRLNAAAHLAGQPLDGLRRYNADEPERFFAFTIPGPDGHTYWDGPRRFVRNDGRTRTPRLWWWERSGGAVLRSGDTVISTCAEPNCLTPEHCEKQHRQARHEVYSDRHMIGLLQVTAGRLGHTPGMREWERLGLHPTTEIYRRRFGGTWESACRAAGLEYETRTGVNLDGFGTAACIASLRAAREILVRWPNPFDYQVGAKRVRMKAKLRDAGLPTDYRTIVARLGPWPEALRKAGKR